jgi:hypothetical protein
MTRRMYEHRFCLCTYPLSQCFLPCCIKLLLYIYDDICKKKIPNYYETTVNSKGDDCNLPFLSSVGLANSTVN